MRSSKNRSRSKGHRNRSVGNIVNRVFDSSGPEGKVRGTPQQIIDKYNQLARDAQLGNDRVAAENFQQHAEHYTRMLGEAQREIEARREQQQDQQQPRDQQQARDDDGDQQDQRPKQDRRQRDRDRDRETADQGGRPEKTFGDVIDTGAEADSGLVETPEGAPKPKAKRSRRRKDEGEAGAGDSGSPQEAAE